MSRSTPEPCYPDHAGTWNVSVVEQQELARDTYRIRLDAPELARRITPGQFVMIRCPELQDPLLGRPFALYDTVDGPSGHPTLVDIVYLVKGKLTRLLRDRTPGQQLEIWGPLGNGFSPPGDVDHAVFVAGGIGQTPFVALAKELTLRRQYGTPARTPKSVRRVTLCYGARSAEYLAGLSDFENAGCDVRIATDDGSYGFHGLVTDLLTTVLAESSVDWIATCGPEPMMAAVAALTTQRGIPCDVSLETPMACGIGACFSCVVPVIQDGEEWDYKRTCIEGPVFPADTIRWDALT